MADRRPHIAIVAFYFPPSRASGVYRMLALANYLQEHGWDVTVITVTRDYFDHITASTDESLLEVIHPDITVERVPIPMKHLERDIRRYGAFRGNFPELHRRLTARAIRQVILDDYGTWIPGVVARLVRVHARHRLDVTLATGNPYSSYAAVWWFRRLTTVPYVLDSRDSWTLNLFTGDLAFPEGHAAYEWEKRTFDEAEAISFVNTPLLAWHQDRYPEAADRMMVVANGYDQAPVPEELDHEVVVADHLRFGYVGTLTGNQPHSQVWSGWLLAKEDPDLEHATMNLYGHLGFFGVSNQLVRQIPLNDERADLTYHGPVGKVEVASAYASLDVLVMIVADSPYVTSGKVFEYMATGKPIVGLYEDDCAVADVLDDYPLVVKAKSLEPEDVADAFIRATHLTPTVTPAQRHAGQEYARQFERSRQLEPLATRLTQIARPR